MIMNPSLVIEAFLAGGLCGVLLTWNLGFKLKEMIEEFNKEDEANGDV